MFSFAQLFVIAAAISTAYGATYERTDNLRDYYLLLQREFLHDVALMNVQIAGVDARIIDRVDLIAHEHERWLNEINAANRTDFLLQTLSLARKHCIQKYDPNLTSYESAANQLELCYKIASDNATSYTSTAKSNLETANYYAASMLSVYAKTCDDRYLGIDEVGRKKCYTDLGSYVQELLYKQLDSTKDSLENALLLSAEACKSAESCSFEVEKNVQEGITQANILIQTCLACFESKSSTAEC